MRALCRLQKDVRGASAVEFALVLPVMLTLAFAGYAISEFVMLSRKVTISTRGLVDLTSQYSSISASDMSTIIGASTQIVAPFDAAPLSIRLSQITTDVTGLIARVSWSVGSNATAYPANQLYVLPLTMQTPSTSYILSEVSYAYTPPVTFKFAGPFTTSAKLFMLPRLSSSITYTGT